MFSVIDVFLDIVSDGTMPQNSRNKNKKRLKNYTREISNALYDYCQGNDIDLVSDLYLPKSVKRDLYRYAVDSPPRISDIALCKLEWKFLQIGRLPYRSYLEKHLSSYIREVIMDAESLIDVLSIEFSSKSEKLLHDAIGKALMSKLVDRKSRRPSYQSCCKWYETDNNKAIIILSQCLLKDGKLDHKLFKEMFYSRVRSSRKLTTMFLK